ncbi:hypothetical protein GCM10022215_33290 [Nocardioides fonticola]|uniref:Uncharacterized protein n=1 Tax=Nocardioides fonticola TaxID=450363 RepID=A0ABP7XTK3_9ACTN
MPGGTPGEAPVGDTTRVSTGWSGLDACRRTLLDAEGRIAAVCTSPRGTRLQLIDPGSLHPDAVRDLPDPGRCGRGVLALRDDGVLVAGSARRLLLLRPSGDGLTTVDAVDLELAADDCLRDVATSGARVWFVSADGVVGALDAGRVRTRALGEPVVTGLAVDATDLVVATTRAVHRLGPDLRPRWRAPYDVGSRTKVGQPGPGTGTRPVVLPGGLVAVTDNADPREQLVVLDRSGEELCRTELFDDGSATGVDLVAVGSSVVVLDTAGWSRWRTALGRAPSGAVARVLVEPGPDGVRCRVAWTASASPAPVVPVVAARTGLVYVVTKRRSWWGVQAWYLTALDVRSGRPAFAVRLGLGEALRPVADRLLLADGDLHLAVRLGQVQVGDRPPGRAR